ncbi:MAG: AAA family ATPase [Rhodoferax sp.]|nr:AAA family ATPase [Rhodoferax sp.]
MATQELNWISVDGFKSISSSGKIHLRPINLIIGPNGSGKSNFIGVFSFLQAIKEGRLYEYVRTAGGAEEVLYFGSKETQEIKIRLSFQNDVNGYELDLKVDNEDNLFALRESVSFWNKQHPSPYLESLSSMDSGKEAGISNAKLTKRVPNYIRTHLDRWRLYHVHDTSQSSPLRRTARVDDSDFLRPDGSNLAAFLYRLQETSAYSGAYSLIRKTVQRVAPFFDDFLLRPDNLNSDVIKLAWRHKSSDKYFGASAFSDGTLRFIALATLFLQPLELRPSVILVDEPELGLHPSAITLLASLVRQASTETQIIASTQSPLLLDYFDPEDVLVANRVDSATTLTRLDSSKLQNWLGDYSLGQLWEKNELGGRPASEKSRAATNQ